MNRILNHFKLHVQIYIDLLIFIIFFGIILSYFLDLDADSKAAREDYSYLKDVVYQAYNIDNNILKFDTDGIALLKMDVLYLGVSNGKSEFSVPPTYNKDFDQCAGYIVVTKISDGNFDIDLSHICDMIDY